MTPIDPATLGSPDPVPPMAPPWVNEDPDIELTERGLEVADDELRDASDDDRSVDDTDGEDPGRDLGETDRSSDGRIAAPEISAVHGKSARFEDDDDER